MTDIFLWRNFEKSGANIVWILIFLLSLAKHQISLYLREYKANVWLQEEFFETKNGLLLGKYYSRWKNNFAFHI